MNYREKIKKLLALSESPNENEAKAALLKARKLMAQEKLTERDLGSAETKEVIREDSGLTFSKRRDPWMVLLSSVIAENYCCRALRVRTRRKQTSRIEFLGLQEDLDICMEIFRYATDCVQSGVNEVRNVCRKRKMDADSTRILCDSYGFGFAAGVKESFRSQDAEEGWGLVMTVPTEVVNAASQFGHSTFQSRTMDQIHAGMYRIGHTEGENFHPEKRLAGEAS